MKFVINKDKLRELNKTDSKDKKYTILLIDDELANLEALTRLLEEEYDVIKAENGFEALNILKDESCSKKINLIISDQRMPGMTGVELLKQTISIVPNAIRIILTGFMDVKDIIDSINEGHIYKFLLKPLEADELLISVKRALETYELKMKNIKLIDELKQTNKKLKKSEVYLSTIFNSVSDAILIHDFNGIIVNVNDTANRLYGYLHDELIGMSIKDIISKNSPYIYDDILKLINDRKKNKINTPVTLEAISIDKNHKEFWVESNSRAIIFNEQKAIIATVRDITERKNTELKSKEEALELEKLRTEFFANISHELRTPLNIILGVIQILRRDLLDKEKPIDKGKIINNIDIERQNCFRLLRLINNLIDSTKLDAGHFEIDMINCNIVSVVEEITLSVAGYIINNNINLIFDTDVEEKIIACDPDKIERIMLNLLSNCIKFTDDDGSIFVNIFDGEEYITLSVEDTGIGIPEEKVEIIFDRFRQVDKSFTRNYEGSGIGLSLVKSLVEMHDGTISVESKYGVGTKFTIKLPVKVLNKSKERVNISNNIINTCVEKINIEFSDIYKQHL
ncbi:ATP-binding protein [Clostridium beijerinckii]|jgi:PAS domain S-box|uniref:Stage 0 sporulation protein A homolog n=2 Tax=Clostridium beijerinckii TaxID=1520 RepID=A0AAE2RR67_CLOBE|nr:ATP-binding protein [Clostridium beijerinckii]ABR36593.1 multi-sensor signal transduction histidine kinase [Clostridium beijerinckii NCIMB 8052]AIU00901.1 multi-sensor signal transduction histidine kinase [Clostridium beijerinckii ATCC 35702]MBF7808761.1 PAS domain S-box protein [Clostridium beijerinckii]NRT22338.1 PAS domain S-box-containing protein [Clostridium beijerinckii]NRT65149.1 PAS domain S-box-containing protein [Clostridium beijerinckii]